MKKDNNLFLDDYNDFKPKKQKNKNVKSKQISFSELDLDNFYQPTNKIKKYVNYK